MHSETIATIAVLALLASPVALLAGVTLGVAASTAYALRVGRRDVMDELQQRLFAPRLRVSLPRRLIGLVVEGFWQTVAFLLQAAHMVRRFRSPPLVRDGGLPVLLVPGYLENSGQMWLLSRRLRARGYQTVLLDLPSTLCAIDDNAAFLAARIEEARAASGARQVGLVVHSMGGLIARSYLHACAERGEDPGVAVVCTIASPHRGTRVARLGIGQSARDMCPGSAWMLQHPPTRRGGPPIHTLIPVQDNIVSPCWATALEQGEDHVLDLAVGHVAPLFLRRVEARVAAWLEAAARDAAPSSSRAGAPAGRATQQQAARTEGAVGP